MRCTWHKSPDVPGGRYLVPGCMNRAVYGDDAPCHCGVSTENDRIDTLEKRLANIEKLLMSNPQLAGNR